MPERGASRSAALPASSRHTTIGIDDRHRHAGGDNLVHADTVVNVAGGGWGRVTNRTEAGGGCQPLDRDEGIPTAKDRAGDPEPGNAFEVLAGTSSTWGHVSTLSPVASFDIFRRSLVECTCPAAPLRVGRGYEERAESSSALSEVRTLTDLGECQLSGECYGVTARS